MMSVRHPNDTSHSYGYAETRVRMSGIMGEGHDRDMDYLRGAIAALEQTLTNMREALARCAKRHAP